VKTQPGIQYSADGVTWDAPVALDASDSGLWRTGTSGSGDPEYYVGVDCPDGFGGMSPPTERLFARLGLFTINVSGTKAEAGQARMRIDLAPVRGGTVTAGPVATGTGGGAVELFTPMTEGLETVNLRQIRMSWEMLANTGDATTRPGYQQSEDGVTWGSVSDLGLTARTGDGITYGTGWENAPFGPLKFTRLGIIGVNGAGSGNGDVEGCVSSLVLDWRYD